VTDSYNKTNEMH